MAPPPIAIINIDDPVLVKLPKPLRAKGQIEGYINAFANPSNAINTTEIRPEVNKAHRQNRIPANAENFNACSCEISLGINMIPIR